MSAFIHRFILTVLAAVLFTTGARAQADDRGFRTSGIERMSVEAWETAQARAYDVKRAAQINAIDRTLHDGVRWAKREVRGVAVVAAAEGQRLASAARRTFVKIAIAGNRFATAALAEADRGSSRDIVLAAHDIAVEGRRLIAEARRTLTTAFAERQRMIAQAENDKASTVVRRLAVEFRRVAVGVDLVFAEMVAESRRAEMSAAREAARDAALTAGKAFRSGRAAAHLMTAPRPAVKASLRVDVEAAIGTVMTARFSPVPEAAPAIRVWKLSRKTMGPAAALAGSAGRGFAQPAALITRNDGDEAMKVRLNAAMDAVEQVGKWLLSAR
ncbi:hypothetical protein sos41_01420 [Alphaproteobacteria bacterium SO-S41]|nr:hypothetical protein sos41_01420 [Alphaproteobacteria bacterium SO-S41]